jgi:hypothetical protein
MGKKSVLVKIIEKTNPNYIIIPVAVISIVIFVVGWFFTK